MASDAAASDNDDLGIESFRDVCIGEVENGADSVAGAFNNNVVLSNAARLMRGTSCR